MSLNKSSYKPFNDNLQDYYEYFIRLVDLGDYRDPVHLVMKYIDFLQRNPDDIIHLPDGREITSDVFSQILLQIMDEVLHHEREMPRFIIQLAVSYKDSILQRFASLQNNLTDNRDNITSIAHVRYLLGETNDDGLSVEQISIKDQLLDLLNVSEDNIDIFLQDERNLVTIIDLLNSWISHLPDNNDIAGRVKRKKCKKKKKRTKKNKTKRNKTKKTK